MNDPLEIFFSYAHEDEELMDDVRMQLIVYERNGQILKWHDRMISPGGDWKGDIDHRLNSAKLVLLFMSPHFIASHYCYEIEGKAALQRHKSGNSVVVPIILRPCAWEATPFGNIQVLPKDGVPITRCDDRDEACLAVARGVMTVVDNIVAKKVHELSSAPSGASLAEQGHKQVAAYCSRCGGVPGRPSECSGYSQHHFVAKTSDAYCNRCGAFPGKPSKCMGYSQHNFVVKTGDVFCSRCGGTPGNPFVCRGYSQHDFVSV